MTEHFKCNKQLRKVGISVSGQIQRKGFSQSETTGDNDRGEAITKKTRGADGTSCNMTLTGMGAVRRYIKVKEEGEDLGNS